jgi:chorismate lyase/3-hydroxybenzoate synthase
MQQHIANDTGGQPPQATDAPRPYAVRLLAAAPQTLGPTVLACVRHARAGAGADAAASAASGDPRQILVELPVLAGSGVELWESALPVRHGWDGDIGYAENGAVLIGQLRLTEAELADTDRAVFHAYARIDGFLRRAGYPAWLRVWNFVAGITRGDGDGERYRQFSLGRYKALSLKSGFERELPAATAIGTRGDGLLIYFVAGPTPGRQIENPRQVSAFRYPRQYGPKSPSFSRANLLRWRDTTELLVSGTASIVGHETLHIGAPLAQFDETVANIEALVAHAAPGVALRPELLKLYLRDPAQLETVRARFAARFGATPAMILHGDVCRSELDLEIEAIFSSAA